MSYFMFDESWLACDDVVLIAPILTTFSHLRAHHENPLRLALLSALFTTTLAQAAELIPSTCTATPIAVAAKSG